MKLEGGGVNFDCTILGRLGAAETKTGPVKLSGMITNAPAVVLPYQPDVDWVFEQVR